MNYRYGIILKQANDYLRQVDTSYMEFIDDKQRKSLRIQTDNKGRFYIEEDVNASKTDKLVKLLEEHGFDVGIVSYLRWKPFPDKPELFE